MKPMHPFPVIACMIAFCLPAAGQGKQIGSADKAAPGYVIIEEDVLYDLPENYPDQPMKAAQKRLAKKDYKAGAIPPFPKA